jgi:hypothetical protein
MRVCMEEGFEKGTPDIEPTVIPYNVFLDAHAQNPNLHKATGAHQLY